MEKQKFKRRQYLVDPQYQLRFATRVLGVLFLIAVLAAAAASFILWYNLYENSLYDQTTLIASLSAIACTILVELIIAIPIVFFLGIRHTHRVVGPITRIKATLEAIGNGDYSKRIHLRDSDVLIDVAKSINTMAETLQKRSNPS